MEITVVRLYKLGFDVVEITKSLGLKYWFVNSVISEYNREPYEIIESKLNYL